MANLNTLPCINLEALTRNELMEHEATFYLLAAFCSATRQARFFRIGGCVNKALEYEKVADSAYASLPDNLKW